MKIYKNDQYVPYKSTQIKAIASKAKIDGILAKWGIKKVAWNWDPENNDVYVQFQIEEVVEGRTITPVVRIEPPRIWDKGSRRRKEAINWDVSMRVMVWYIKTHLEMAYLLRSSKTTEFLPYINIPTKDGEKVLKDVILPDLQALRALPEYSEQEIGTRLPK